MIVDTSVKVFKRENTSHCIRFVSEIYNQKHNDSDGALRTMGKGHCSDVCSYNFCNCKNYYKQLIKNSF